MSYSLSGNTGGGHTAQARVSSPLATVPRPQLAEEERRDQAARGPGLDIKIHGRCLLRD